MKTKNPLKKPQKPKKCRKWSKNKKKILKNIEKSQKIVFFHFSKKNKTFGKKMLFF